MPKDKEKDLFEVLIKMWTSAIEETNSWTNTIISIKLKGSSGSLELKKHTMQKIPRVRAYLIEETELKIQRPPVPMENQNS